MGSELRRCPACGGKPGGSSPLCTPCYARIQQPLAPPATSGETPLVDYGAEDHSDCVWSCNDCGHVNNVRSACPCGRPSPFVKPPPPTSPDAALVERLRALSATMRERADQVRCTGYVTGAWVMAEWADELDAALSARPRAEGE